MILAPAGKLKLILSFVSKCFDTEEDTMARSWKTRVGRNQTQSLAVMFKTQYLKTFFSISVAFYLSRIRSTLIGSPRLKRFFQNFHGRVFRCCKKCAVQLSCFFLLDLGTFFSVEQLKVNVSVAGGQLLLK